MFGGVRGGYYITSFASVVVWGEGVQVVLWLTVRKVGMNSLPTYTVADHIYSAYFRKSSGSIATEEVHGAPATVASPRPQIPSVILPSVLPSGVLSLELDDARASPTPDGTPPMVVASPTQQISQPLQQSPDPGVVAKRERAGVPPLAIAGIAVGGVIALGIALVAAFMVLKRRRRIGRVRQSSIASADRAPSQSPVLTTEVKEGDLPSSLDVPSDASGPSKKSIKHITWKDQVCPEEPFTTHHSLWSRSSGASRDKEEHTETCRVGATHGLPNAHLAYRSFSSPVLASHVSASGGCCSTISPLPGCIFPTHVHSLRGDPKFPHPHYLSWEQQQQQQQGPAVLCTSIYSFLPGGGRRSLSDSFTTPGPCAPTPARRSSIRQSGYVQAYSPSLFRPAHTGELSKKSEHCDGQEPGESSNYGNNCFSTFGVTSGHSASISSVSSTGSSILNYTVGNTPQKLFQGRKTTAIAAGAVVGVDDSSSSPPSSLESPPTGGLTSPHSRRGGEVPFPRSLFQGTDTPLEGENNRSIGGADGDGAELGNIGLALSPSLPSNLFDDTALSDKARTGDVFLDRPSLDSTASGQDVTSSRHFSCSMPTRPRLLSLKSPPSLRESPEGSPDDVLFPTASSSPISPSNGYPPTPNPASELEFGPLGALPVKSSRRMLGSVESTYSPTLSMVNYYSSIARNPADTRFSSVNLFSPFTFPSPPGPATFTFSPIGSPVGRFERMSVEMGGSIRESLVMDYSPKTRPISVGLESITTVGEGSLDLQGGLGIMDGRCRKRRRYSSRFFTNGEGVLTIDDGGVEEDCLDGGVSLGEGRGERAESVD